MLRRRQEMSRDAAGVSQAKDLGPAVWSWRFRSRSLDLVDAQNLMADLRSLNGAVHSFFVHPTERPFPVAASGPGDLTGSTVTVKNISAGRDELAVEGLPANFVLTRGDFLSIATTGGGIAFVELAEDQPAFASGATTLGAVSPIVVPGVEVGAAVTLVNPPCEVRLVPGTLDDVIVNARRRAVVFEAEQVIR